MPDKKIAVAGKVAFVSGANRGIGKAIAEALIESGAEKVYAGARDVASLDEMAQKHGDKLVPVQLDVTDDSSIAQAAEQAKDTDILVNNAGVLQWGNFSQGNAVETLKQNMDVNVFGVAKLTGAMLPALKEKDAAAIATVSSVAGLANMPMGLTYSASKAAVHSMIQGMRAELKDSNIFVTGIYPGPIDTDMTQGVDMDKETPENVAKNVIAGMEQGDEYIFPDPMAQQVGQGYMSAPKAVEEQFAAFVG